MNRKSLIYGISGGIINSTVIEFLPIYNVLKGFLSFIVFILLLMFLFAKIKPELKIILKQFAVFIVVYLASTILMTYIYNIGSELNNVAIYKINRIATFVVIGLIIVFFRLSKKHFIKLSSIIFLFFVGMLLFTVFNKEIVQELISTQQKENLKIENLESNRE